MLRTRTVAGVLLTLCASSDIWGQTTVIVEGVSPRRSATITQADLEAGVYQGQTFMLGPDTTIVLRNNGRLGTLGSMAAGPFDLAGTVVRAEAGGAIAGYYESFFSNATVTLLEGASTFGELTLRDVTLHVAGGEIGGPYGDSLSIAGGTIRVSDGGRIHRTWLSEGAALEVSSGSAGYVVLDENCTADLSGGRATHILARPGSEVSVSGGIFLMLLQNQGAAVSIFGDDLRIDNVPVATLPAEYPSGSIVTATLADGTPTVILSYPTGLASFIQTDVPPLHPGPITVPPGPAPLGLRPDEVLVLEDGGALGADFTAVGAVLDVRGGVVGPGAQLVYSDVVMSGGVLEQDARLLGDSTLMASGTSSIEELRALHESRCFFTGGTHGEIVFADNSYARISGGRVAQVSTAPGAALEIVGGDFRLDGTPITELRLPLGGSTFYGTLPDGSVFLYREDMGGFSAGTVTLTQVPLPPLDLAPIVVDGELPEPNGLREGQTIILRDGGVLPGNFGILPGAALVVEGGLVGSGARALDANITVTGGEIGSLTAMGATTMEVRGGSVGWHLMTDQASVIIDGGEVTSAIIEEDVEYTVRSGTIGGHTAVRGRARMVMTGGSISRMAILQDSSFEMQGGTMHGNMTAVDRGRVAINGGVFNDRIDAEDHSTMTITGGTFLYWWTQVEDFAHVSISGGDFHGDMGGANESILDISGGIFRGSISIGNHATNISGGSISSFRAVDDGVVNLVVRDISVGGVPLDLAPGEVRIITEREGLPLNATLASGDRFDVILDPVFENRKQWVFEPTVTLTARLATPPCQCDAAEPIGQINIADLLTYLDDWFRQDPAADLDANGQTDAFDLMAFIDCWLSATSTGFCDP